MTKRVLRLLIRQGLRQGWRRGVLGDSRAFLFVGGAAVIGRLALRALDVEADVVFSEKLAPGETFAVLHEPRG